MAFFGSWKNVPIICWAYDKIDTWRKIIGENFYDDEVSRYKTEFDTRCYPILFSMGMNFNLGGQKDKVRLETTSKPIGVFDFSLASKGLYRMPEFYSELLAQDYPNLFDNYGMPSGVVPPNFVKNVKMILDGRISYAFSYSYDGKSYILQKRQRGTTEILSKCPFAVSKVDSSSGFVLPFSLKNGKIINNYGKSKLKYATTTKDVYLKFRRQGGKVNYVELYSLFYYTSLNGEDEYMIRHLPAIMVCEYFESIGVKSRFYLTRFCNPMASNILRTYDLATKQKLPMTKEYEDVRGRNTISNEIIFAPIVVKDFGEEFNYVNSLVVSRANNRSVYNAIIADMCTKELTEDITPYGNPDQSQRRYLEAFARYKQKYQIYVKEGLWKSKEVQEQGQILFHSQSIKNYLSSIRVDIQDAYYKNFNILKLNWSEFLQSSLVLRTFFEWWMRVAANRSKDTILVFVTKEPRKEIKNAITQLSDLIDEINSFLDVIVPEKFRENTNQHNYERYVATILKRYIQSILYEEGLPLDINGRYNFYEYFQRIIQDATTFADTPLFQTPDDVVEDYDKRVEVLDKELSQL